MIQGESDEQETDRTKARARSSCPIRVGITDRTPSMTIASKTTTWLTQGYDAAPSKYGRIANPSPTGIATKARFARTRRPLPRILRRITGSLSAGTS